MTTLNTRTVYDSFKIVRRGNDAVIQVPNPDGTLREIAYEEFLATHHDFDLLRDGKKMHMEWIAESFWDVRRESGLKQVLLTLTDIFGKDNFTLWQPTFTGRYICQVGNLDDQEKDFDEEYAWMMERIESVVGTPSVPELVFTGNRDDGKCGWELSFTDTDDEVFAFAEWDDTDGIIALTKIFSDPEACLSTFATALPEEHALFVAHQAYRNQNEEAMKLMGIDAHFVFSDFSKVILPLVEAHEVEYPLILNVSLKKIQMNFWNENTSSVSEVEDERYDHYNPEAKQVIGAMISLAGKNVPEGNLETQKVWDEIREATQKLGYAFIDRTDAGRMADLSSFVYLATIPINLAFYEAMHDQYFRLAESA